MCNVSKAMPAANATTCVHLRVTCRCPKLQATVVFDPWLDPFVFKENPRSKEYTWSSLNVANDDVLDRDSPGDSFANS